jgi:hypothetical protein
MKPDAIAAAGRRASVPCHARERPAADDIET